MKRLTFVMWMGFLAFCYFVPDGFSLSIDVVIPDRLDLSLDVSPLPGRETHFPIEIMLLEPVTEIRVLVEHPFWGMKPDVKFSTDYVVNGSAQIVTANQIALNITTKYHPNDHINSPVPVALITINGIEMDYIRALQYPPWWEEPSQPIRYSPPVYPVQLREVSVNTSDEVKNLPDLSKAFYLVELPTTRRPVQVRKTSFPPCDEPILRLTKVNHWPLLDDSITVSLNQTGEGEISLPFNNNISRMEIYEPTLLEFELLCNGERIAVSEVIQLPSVQEDPMIRVPLKSYSEIKGWYYQK